MASDERNTLTVFINEENVSSHVSKYVAPKNQSVQTLECYYVSGQLKTAISFESGHAAECRSTTVVHNCSYAVTEISPLEQNGQPPSPATSRGGDIGMSNNRHGTRPSKRPYY
jgi:hypothetical protein